MALPFQPPYGYKPLPEQIPVPTQRMTSGIERIFVPTPDSNVFQEVFIHVVHFLDENSNIIRTKQQKRINGKLYKALGPNESGGSMSGTVDYTFPDGTTKRLVGLGMTYEDLIYGARHDPSKGML